VAPGIPRFFLYGEPERDAGERFVHVELIADRSGPNEWRVRPHTHSDLHQLFLILRGGGQLRADEARCRLTAPTLILVPAGIVHAFTFQPATHGYVVTICDPLLRAMTTREPAFASLFVEPQWLQLRDENIRDYELEVGAERLLRELRMGAPAQITAAEAHLQILLACAARLSCASAGPPQTLAAPTHHRAAGLVNAFRGLVEAHFRDNWQLQDYAQALYVSSARLRSSCVRVAGAPPVQLIHDCAIRAAKRDLVYTSRSVSEIANALGFEDPAYFSRFFHKRCGISPSEFRLRTRHPAAAPAV
jgi:AraC family transcriptional activator of pobA